MFIHNTQNPSKFYHSPWFWAGALFSLGGAALLTIGLLAQFQVIHHIGSFSHQSIPFFSGATAFSEGLGAAGCFLLASVKKAQIPQSTPPQIKERDESPSQLITGDPIPSKPEAVIASRLDSPDENNKTGESHHSTDELSTPSFSQSGLKWVEDEIWVLDPNTQKDNEYSGPPLKLKIYGFLPQERSLDRLKKQFSYKLFDDEELKNAIKEIDEIIVITYQKQIFFNKAEYVHILWKGESKVLGKGLQIFSIQKENQTFYISSKENEQRMSIHFHI